MAHNPFHPNLADLTGATLLGAKLDRKVSTNFIKKLIEFSDPNQNFN